MNFFILVTFLFFLLFGSFSIPYPALKAMSELISKEFLITSTDPAPVSNVDEEPLDESPDEGDSQATDSVLGDPDIYLGYQSDCSTTLRDRNA